MIEKLKKPSLKMTVPSVSSIFQDYKFYQFSLAIKGIVFLRLYCIISIIGMIVVDA